MLYVCNQCKKQNKVKKNAKYYCGCQNNTTGTLLHTQLTDIAYIFIDFETTGLCVAEDDVIQMAFSIFSHTQIELYKYHSFVHTSKLLSSKITEITGIHQENILTAPSFTDSFQMLIEQIELLSIHYHHFIFVAHNGFDFDYHFLKRYMNGSKLSLPTIDKDSKSIHYWLTDSLVICRKIDKQVLSLSNYRLGTIYQSLYQTEMKGLHQAHQDIVALANVFYHPVIYPFSLSEIVPFEIHYDGVDIEQLDILCGHTFSSQQLEIIESELDIHQCVIAGAGCAKTTTIIGRLIYLLNKGVNPESIVFCTFTRDAAETMATKLNEWTKQKVPVISGTIDSIARRFVREYDRDLFNTCSHVGDYKYALVSLLSRIYCPKRIALTDRIKYIFFDEFQDINETYFNIIKLFSDRGTYIIGVGDDSQNIYEWNNTNIEYILKFDRFFTNSQLFYLTTNYRSTPEIVNLANASIDMNTNKYPKNMYPVKKSVNCLPEVHSFQSWKNECSFVIQKAKELHSHYRIPYHEMVIMSRTNTDKGQLFYIEEQLVKDGIPIYMLENSGEQKSTVTTTAVKKNHLYISTIHKTKGLEWEVVFLVGCNDAFFPGAFKNDRQLEEERRLFYVAITRAKTFLYLSFTSSYQNKYVTRFISEVDRTLLHFNDSYYDRFIMKNEVDSVYSSIRQVVSVTKLISLFRDEHIQYIKNMPTHHFPTLVWKDSFIHKPFEYPKWVKEAGLHCDFGIWIDNVITRQIYDSDRTSWIEPIVHLQGKKIQSILVLEGADFDVYGRYKCSIYLYLRKIVFEKIDVDSDRTVFLKMIEKPFHSKVAKLPPILERDQQQVYRLLCRLWEHSKKYSIEPFEIMITNRSILDGCESTEFMNCLLSYMDRTKQWNEILWETFIVSWSSMIEKGRRRLLHYNWKKEHITSDLNDFFQTIKERFVDQLVEKKPYCKLSIPSDISNEIDLYLENDEGAGTIVEYKVSAMDSNALLSPPIEHIFQLLLYACIMLQKGYDVQKIAIYNPLSGTYRESDIREWVGNGHHMAFYETMLWFAYSFNHDKKVETIVERSDSPSNQFGIQIDISFTDTKKDVLVEITEAIVATDSVVEIDDIWID